MQKVLIIFPHQLFERVLDMKFLSDFEHIILHEHPLYFTQYKYHKQKMLLHRASMKMLEHNLGEIISKNKLKIKVKYFEYTDDLDSVFEFIDTHNKKGVEINYFNVTDDYLEKELVKNKIKYKCELNKMETPQFYFTESETIEMLLGKNDISKVKKLLMKSYYEKVRNKTGILMHADKKPIGGKYSYDADNRDKYKGEVPLPKNIYFKRSKLEIEILAEAQKYVEANFKNNVGQIYLEDDRIENFKYPINHTEAKFMLAKFIDERLEYFGKYEDAILQEETDLFHSTLSSSLNIGLITPKEVIDRVVEIKVTDDNIASVEGFIRQVIGWREYMRATYVTLGSKMRKSNVMNHKNKMADSLYSASSGLEIFDNNFAKLEKTAYNHHIERLMIFGNLFFMLQIDPDEVYDWFMMHYIDAYDWVMVGNVYAMSQYASEMLTSKPYFASSNYLIKMSDFKKSKEEGEWCDIFDTLYWHTVNHHRVTLMKNIRLAMMVRMYDKFDDEKRKGIEKRAKAIFAKYTK
jgi:deoxyribodipyrimidine photolyase-related protein